MYRKFSFRKYTSKATECNIFYAPISNRFLTRLAKVESQKVIKSKVRMSKVESLTFDFLTSDL